MPTLIEKLNKDKQKIAHRIIHNILELEKQAITYSEDIDKFKIELRSSISEKDFFAVVQEIIAKGKKVYETLHHAMNSNDDEILKAIEEHILKDEKLTRIMNSLHFNQSLSSSIIATKERLSRNVLINNLPAAQKDIVENFIRRVEELKIFTKLLDSQKEIFRQRLSNTTSLEELSDIEDEIEKQDKVIHSLYADTIIYPENEDTAGALIKYLETNQQVLAIIRSFDFYEELADDILASRAKITSSLSQRR